MATENDVDKRIERLTMIILAISMIAAAIYDHLNLFYKPFAILTAFFVGSIPFFVVSYSQKFRKIMIAENKKYHISLIVMGALIIIAGIVADNVMPWVDQITLTNIESCIADMHFRNHNETQFQECVSPDLKKIESIQKMNTLTTILYSMGGIFIGLGFTKKLV